MQNSLWEVRHLKEMGDYPPKELTPRCDKRPSGCQSQPQKQTAASNPQDPQIENHKSVHSEEQALICDGASAQGGSAKWQEPGENLRDLFT